MFSQTASRLRCVARKNCGSLLQLSSSVTHGSGDIEYGELRCSKCNAVYPILAGVAVVVPKVREYLLAHVKGVTRHVPDTRIPKPYQREFIAYRKQIETDSVEMDLESDRVNALYLMNHYLRVENSKEEWWESESQPKNGVIAELVKKYWDQGPLTLVQKWVSELASAPDTVELGCGVGGLLSRIAPHVKSYLGIDNTFQSIFLARAINFGDFKSLDLKIPDDLLQGGLGRNFAPQTSPVKSNGNFDFVVGEIEALPLERLSGDLSISLNAIDMLEDPRQLAQTQNQFLKEQGLAIQTGPYIWNERVSKKLRSILPKTATDSASAVEWIYQKTGFEVDKRQDQLPWLFYKHARQLEIYSVHAFLARKSGQG